jgi:hypothetical protein
VLAAVVDYSAPEVVERTKQLLEEYVKVPPPSEDVVMVAIHKGVDPKAVDEVRKGLMVGSLMSSKNGARLIVIIYFLNTPPPPASLCVKGWLDGAYACCSKRSRARSESTARGRS